ncbi:MAG TPA: LCP family protein [Negativicutes bacterium]|jgi:LCP family protein required for cell wall assembly
MNPITNESCSKNKKTRCINKKRAFLLITMIFLLIAGIFCVFFSENTAETQVSKTLTPSSKGKINVLVLGVDKREDDVGRSDTTFVVTIDTVMKKVTTLSIPRDSRTKIAGHGWDKINHAYAFGGSKLSKATVENLLGIPIDYTVVVDFNGFVRMVDAVGGITINVEKRMYYSDPYDGDGGLYINLQPGVQRLSGRSAIQYVRYRDEEGDIGRVTRQQKFLKALMEEFTKPQLITKLPILIKEFASAVRTDMPITDMLTLIPIVNDAAKTGLNSEWVSGAPLWIQDVSYWLPDIKELRVKVAQIQGIAIDDRYIQSTERLIDEYRQSIPQETKVAKAPPASQTTLVLDKQATVTTTRISAPTKPKVESIHTNERSISGSKVTSVTSSSNSTASDTSSGAVHIKAVVDAGGK